MDHPFLFLCSSFFFSSFSFFLGWEESQSGSLSLNSLFILKNPNNSLCFFFFFIPSLLLLVSSLSLSLSPPSLPFSCFCKVCFTLPAFGSSCFSVSEKSYRFFLFVQSYVRVSMWLLASLFFSPYFLPFLLFLRK